MNWFELQKENEKLKKEIKSLKKAYIEPWQGKSGLNISKCDGYWEVVSYQKVKETGEVKEIKRKVPDKNVSEMVFALKEIGKTQTTSKEVAQKIIEKNGLRINLDEFWGGKNRKKMFILLYYPLHICRHIGMIRYDSKGNVFIKGLNYFQY